MSTPIKTDSLRTKRLRRKTSVQFSSVGDVHVHFSSPHWLMTCNCSNCTDTLQLTCDLRQFRQIKIRKTKEHCSWLANSFNLETASHRWIFWQIWCWYQSPSSCAKKSSLELSLHRNPISIFLGKEMGNVCVKFTWDWSKNCTILCLKRLIVTHCTWGKNRKITQISSAKDVFLIAGSCKRSLRVISWKRFGPY